MAWQYSKKTEQLFMDAVSGKEGTHLGEIENPDGIGEHGSIACGDALKFTFRVKKHPEDPTKDIIIQAKYLTFGCTSAIASSEALCAIIEQRKCTPIEALKITNKDIIDYLEGLPSQKIHCSVMGAEALLAAVKDWAKKRGVDLRKYGINVDELTNEDEGRIVCKCFGCSSPYLKRKIKELNLKSVEEVTSALKAGGACGSCLYSEGGIQDILNEIYKDKSNPFESSEKADTRKVVSPYQRYKKIEEVIDKKIRPSLQKDGGDIEIIDIKENIVYCTLKGACENCAGAKATLKSFIERVLKDEVDENITVISV